jgi:uncharacterized membrane protein YedE/YeeE
MSRVNLVALSFGATFGFAFSAAGFNQYDIVHRTLLLQYWPPWLVFASAVGTALPSLWLLERIGWHTPLGGQLRFVRWKMQRDRVLGGAVFGLGWAVTGACPGTLSTMVAAGSLLGLMTLAGVMVGIAARDYVVERDAEPGVSSAPQATSISVSGE